MAKKKLTLSIEEGIIENAKKAEINLSSFLEIRLIDYLSNKEQCSRREGNLNLLVILIVNILLMRNSLSNINY
jgi:predicted DNA-binding ribbon-helix-helix protein